MTTRRLIAALLAIVGLAAAAAVIALSSRPNGLGVRPPAQRPELLLLTTLPIVFPDEFTLDSKASPVLAALQGRYRVVPISIADGNSLAGHKLLLMAQPQAQPAEVLVELDAWVRDGGRVLLLADPVLQWPSERPLGDLLRPPVAFADTGLLGHWGLKLAAPGQLGPESLTVDGRGIETVAPGDLAANSANCAVDPSRLIARCRVGKGLATVIADADFLDLDRTGSSKDENLALLLGELDRLDH